MERHDDYDSYRPRPLPTRVAEGVVQTEQCARSFLSRLWADYVIGFFSFLGGVSRELWRGLTAGRLARVAPAVLFLAACLILTLMALVAPDKPLRDRYTARSQHALRAGRHEEARICFLRLLRWGFSQKEVNYGLALCLFAQGDDRRGEALLRALAPTEGGGYGPAHLTAAIRLLAKVELRPEEAQAAERHLLAALRADGRLTEAHALLGQMYAQLGQVRWTEAKEHLSKARIVKPHLNLMLAQLAAAEGNQEEAKRYALDATSEFRKRTDAEPDNPAPRLALAEAQSLVGLHAEAVELARQAKFRAKTREESAACDELLGRIYLAWHHAERSKTNANPEVCFALLDSGLKHNPRDEQLLQALLDSAQGKDQSAEQARNRLRLLAASGQAASTLHLCLGVDAWSRKQFSEAKLHLETAFRLDARMPYVANNLAWILANGPEPDLHRALEIISSVLELQPNDPEFRDTRGQILVKLGKYQEALPDLTFALSRLPGSSRSLPSLHGALAVAYAKLGLQEQAAVHKAKSVPDALK